MKTKIFIALTACFLSGVLSFKNTASKKSSQTFEPIAVIELFTSQGCSSCPPADALLAQTISDSKSNGKKIFSLSFHVDYWNRLGWADPFSNEKYSQRQNDYASVLNLQSVYTPQMIVNGLEEFVGSSKNDLQMALSKSLASNAEVNFKSLTVTLQNETIPHLDFSLEGNYEGCKINFALVSLSETTSIRKGENGGRTLTNKNVVRQFISIPSVASGELDFQSDNLPAENNMSIIAFVQRDSDKRIIGAALTQMK